MPLDFMFFANSLLLGIGLAMDAFSVSLANGLHEPQMKGGKICIIAGVFGIFQGLMPLLGWICLHTLVQYFRLLQDLIPWLALGLLSYIGIKMILENLKGCQCDGTCSRLTLSGLLLQGIATSIDALSVGFTIADYDLPAASLSALIIAAVTFLICTAGIFIGKTVGTRMAGKAGIFGGVILLLVGLEIFLSSFF